MKRLAFAALAALPVSLMIAASSASADDYTLKAVKASAAPTLDGMANDAVWGSAPEIPITTVKGANFGGTGGTTGTMKAAYDGENLYIRASCKILVFPRNFSL